MVAQPARSTALTAPKVTVAKRTPLKAIVDATSSNTNRYIRERLGCAAIACASYDLPEAIRILADIVNTD